MNRLPTPRYNEPIAARVRWLLDRIEYLEELYLDYEEGCLPSYVDKELMICYQELDLITRAD